MRLKTVQKGSLVDAVVEKLRKAIESGSLTSGDRLPAEPELTAKLGVSRTVLREAIIRLQSAGLVTIKRGTGTYVADQNGLLACTQLMRTAMAISSEELIRFVELREAIESYAARRAAALATVKDVAELSDFCQQMKEEGADYEEAMQHDLQFHLRLVEIAGNRLMLSVLEILQEFILAGMLRTKPKQIQPLVNKRYHMAIVDALRNHDSEAAEAAVHAHMNLLIRRLQEGAKPKRKESARNA
jgi:GntR family transcriptional repressor for pyruvate dehydrogenase complex